MPILRKSPAGSPTSPPDRLERVTASTTSSAPCKVSDSIQLGRAARRLRADDFSGCGSPAGGKPPRDNVEREGVGVGGRESDMIGSRAHAFRGAIFIRGRLALGSACGSIGVGGMPGNKEGLEIAKKERQFRRVGKISQHGTQVRAICRTASLSVSPRGGVRHAVATADSGASAKRGARGVPGGTYRRRSFP